MSNPANYLNSKTLWIGEAHLHCSYSLGFTAGKLLLYHLGVSNVPAEPGAVGGLGRQLLDTLNSWFLKEVSGLILLRLDFTCLHLLKYFSVLFSCQGVSYSEQHPPHQNFITSSKTFLRFTCFVKNKQFYLQQLHPQYPCDHFTLINHLLKNAYIIEISF